ncbi:MAG: hypothetical protein ACFFFB_16370, partial [Candidatus Heimdallarchaeota archaeon]
YGDEVINKYDSKNLITVPKEKLFELSDEFPTEFIIPGARPDVINRKNIDKIEACAIVPAANIPYEKEILKVIKEKGIVAFPDFVVNAGEVLAIYIGKAAKNVDEIFSYLKSKITEKILDIINGSNEESTTIYNYAMENAIKELKKKIKRKENTLKKLNKRF